MGRNELFIHYFAIGAVQSHAAGDNFYGDFVRRQPFEAERVESAECRSDIVDTAVMTVLFSVKFEKDA